MMGVYDDSFIQDYKELTDMSHENNCPIMIQLPFAGSNGIMWTPTDPSTAEINHDSAFW